VLQSASYYGGQAVDLRTLITLDPTIRDNIFVQISNKGEKIGGGASSTVYKFYLPDRTVAGKKIRINLFNINTDELDRLKKVVREKNNNYCFAKQKCYF
jgi:hypothetical protein